VGRPKGVNLGLPHPFVWNKTKRLCVGFVEVFTQRNRTQITTKIYIQVYIFKY